MAAQKFLTQSGGRIVEAQAVDTSSGSGDSGKLAALDGSGKFAAGFLPAQTGANASITASEALSAGDLVNIHNSTGEKARKADNSAAGKEANGFVLAGVSSAASGTVYFAGNILTGLTSLTPGARQYLGTSGAITATAPTGSGAIVQCIGIAISATAIMFAPEAPITLT
jgi:hypothetical protein